MESNFQVLFAFFSGRFSVYFRIISTVVISDHSTLMYLSVTFHFAAHQYKLLSDIHHKAHFNMLEWLYTFDFTIFRNAFLPLNMWILLNGSSRKKVICCMTIFFQGFPLFRELEASAFKTESGTFCCSGCHQDVLKLSKKDICYSLTLLPLLLFSS